MGAEAGGATAAGEGPSADDAGSAAADAADADCAAADAGSVEVGSARAEGVRFRLLSRAGDSSPTIMTLRSLLGRSVGTKLSCKVACFLAPVEVGTDSDQVFCTGHLPTLYAWHTYASVEEHCHCRQPQ